MAPTNSVNIATLFGLLGSLRAGNTETQTLTERLPELEGMDGPQIEAYIRLMAMAACSDGEIQDQELELLEASVAHWLEEAQISDDEREVLEAMDLRSAVQQLSQLSWGHPDGEIQAVLEETAVSFEPGQCEAVFAHALALLHLYGVERSELRFATMLANALGLDDARIASLRSTLALS